MHAARMAKFASDPEYAKKVLDLWAKKNAKHSARMKADPDYARKCLTKARAAYFRDAEIIQAKRAERRDSMTAQELAAWRAKMREYSNRHLQKKREIEFLEIQAELARRIGNATDRSQASGE